MSESIRILILGGGFAGINTLRKIQKDFEKNENVRITLVSKDNYFLFTPMLPGVATGLIHPNDITIPIRRLCKKAEFFQAEVASIDLEQKLVIITRTFDGKIETLEYDYLVLALGSGTNFYGNEKIKEHSFVIKSVEDAIAIRTQAINMLENAAQTLDQDFQKKLMTFVVVGAGFAGVETIGELNHFVRDSVRNFYPSIGEDKIKMILVSSQNGILPEVGENLGKVALSYLRERGVIVFTNAKAVDADESYVRLDDDQKIDCFTLIWTAGVKVDAVIVDLKCQHDKSGKVLVDKYLRVIDHPEVFALGDCASIMDQSSGRPYPPTAQHAIHESHTVTHNLRASITGKQDLKSYTFRSRGMMATIGKRAGVAVVFGYNFRGIFAWLLWRSYYLSNMPHLEKKVRVLTSWAINGLFKRDLTFVGMIKKKSLTQVEIKAVPSIKDLFQDAGKNDPKL